MRLSRRSVLVGGAVALGGISSRALADAETNLRGGELLPPPDFARLRKNNPYVVGVRPHRKGGVRLELSPEPLNGKTVIHNYGHGGGGITLSWGCASVATELVAEAIAKLPKDAVASVAILGTGVIGLTTATELRRRWPDLQLAVYAKDLDVRTTTSFVAGGQFEPSGIFREYDSPEGKKRFGDYLRRSRDRIVALQSSGQRLLFGVAERKNYTLDHEIPALDVFTPPDVVARFRKGKLPFEKLNVVGREYSNWLMNPTILLPKLAADLAAPNVKFEQRDFQSLSDVAALPQRIIVNCTGYGAKKLFADDAMVPQRGHLVVLEKTHDKQLYFFSGGCENRVISYAFCRQNDVVIGGTVISGDENGSVTDKDTAVFKKLVANSRELFGGNPAACKW